MALDLLPQVGTSFDSSYANNTWRPSRWEEKQTGQEDAPLSGGNTAMTIDDMDDEFLQMRDEIRDEVSGILNNATRVKSLCGEYKMATIDEHPTIMTKMDTTIQQNTTLTTQIKWRIEKEKQKISQSTSNINSLKVKEFNLMVMGFKKACTVFSQSLTEYDSVVRGEQIRQLDIVDVNKELSEQDKNELLDSDDPKAVQKFIDQKYALTEAPSDILLQRVVSLEQTHAGMLKIERGVRELRDLFNELNILIIEQQDLIDHVDSNVQETKTLVQAGTKHLETAEQHQKKTRKMMLIGSICCLIILLILVISLTS
eukprot:437797_1